MIRVWTSAQLKERLTAAADLCSMCDGFGSREYAATGKVATCPRCKGSGKAFVIRYVVTHINRDGMRTLAHAAQGRNTYATPEEAQEWIDAARANATNDLGGIYPHPDPLAVRPCECWPVHFDPKGVWFDE